VAEWAVVELLAAPFRSVNREAGASSRDGAAGQTRRNDSAAKIVIALRASLKALAEVCGLLLIVWTTLKVNFSAPDYCLEQAVLIFSLKLEEIKLGYAVLD
jgi:hypothetical protein